MINRNQQRKRTRPGEARAWLEGYLASMEAGAFTTSACCGRFHRMVGEADATRRRRSA
jgi:hypothetical protein